MPGSIIVARELVDIDVGFFYSRKRGTMFRSTELNLTRKVTIAGLVMAAYVVIMFYTQSFAFGQYQVRIATALYGMSAIFPFLVIPMGLANLLSNTIMGGLGVLDIVGGTCVGIVSSGLIVLVKKQHLPNYLIAVIITLVPGLGVPIWLSILLNIPYLVLAPSLVIGQIIPGIAGACLVTALEKRGVTEQSFREKRA